MVAVMDITEATLTLDGLTVKAELTQTDDGPLLTVGGVGCNLEGIAPGEYLLVTHSLV